jgi:hypothetical protein
MKMKPETFDALKAAVMPTMAHIQRVKGEVNERLRWDCLWASKFPVNRLYNEGLNDSHIDTALRAIAVWVKP